MRFSPFHFRPFSTLRRAGPAGAFLAVLCFGIAPPALAVLERAGEHIHDASAFRLFVTNLGVLGNPTYPSFSDHPSLEWPAGSGNEFLLEAGLWVGARDRTGVVLGVSTAGPVSEFRPSLDLVDHVYESFDGAPGTRRFGTTPEVEEADDDLDGAIDEEFLNGKDDDGDGRIDEDYAALGTQMFSCEYRDDTEEARQQLLAHRPLGLKVEQSSWVWAEGIAGLDHVAVVTYHVTNVSPASLFDVFLGFYVDPDVGPKARDGHWRDDRYSVETMSGTFANHAAAPAPGCQRVPYERTVVVVEDAPDGVGGAAGGDAPGVIGALMLDQTTSAFAFRAPDAEAPMPRAVVHLAGRITFDRTREEISDPEKYALLSRTGFDGDNTISDHRFILTAGPYSELLPGASIDLTCALVVAADRTELAANVAAIEDNFYGRWLNLDGLTSTGRDGRETCLTKDDAPFCFFSPFAVDTDCDEPQTQVRHHGGCWNPFVQTFCPGAPGPPANRCSDRARVLTTQCVFVDMDCDSCTPNTAGAETLVRWATTVTEVSSRPLEKRVAAGDRSAVIEWDNAAELPTAQRVLPPVAGYRVWRAEGWTRPPGSSGPLADQWRLVAELPLPASGLPPPHQEFIVDGVPVIEQVPGPKDSLYPHYDVGRYRFEDSGLLNGFAVFYDVTPFSVDPQPGGTVILHSLDPRARAGTQIFPAEAPAADPGAAPGIRVIPNPYVEHASWDLSPNRTDPSGRKIVFAGLPAERATVHIYTLAGDIVRTLENDGQTGTVDWDLLSRNGQPVTTGVYLYVVEAPGLRHHGKLVIVQ
jgi:hypothetical protein